MTRDELFDLAEKAGLGFIRHASDKDVNKFEQLAALVASAEREKYEAVITNMAKLLEAQQNREGVAIDMIAAGIAAEREACAKVADIAEPYKCADLIRAR
jgi:hypothetical protein